MNQAFGGFLFHLMIIFLFVDPYINFSTTFFIAMSHQILLVSLVLYNFNVFDKKIQQQDSINFFFNSGNISFYGLAFLNETLTNLDLIGFFITSVGVYIATRN